MRINIRKGLFETSSSSEDSVSVYQDMKLFIWPKDLYNEFVEGKIYGCFANINPSFTDEYADMLEYNEESIKKYNLAKHLVSKKEITSVDDLSNYIIFNNFNKLFIDYKTWQNVLRCHYYDVEFFEYENEGNIIFGYYGYTEE